MHQKLPLNCHTDFKTPMNYLEVLHGMGIEIVEPQYDELFI